ncbi:unnamed protein product [Acanthoscelides obtectus]|uniref:Uncharacterized protein n=1 Tax=Acanthoscelides obtectus TaxID=200917 RepID=A0A9P0KLQ2_ACAOB|nr:unnamed protein product [Acanthoscelides obtectus]CAK1674897.1 hypothetical protein AOBTE_LOCUS29802 [Acanthoscelides obtectus]
MCNYSEKFGRATFMIFGIFVLFYFAECAAGSCLSYGHACWGGHGKRSDSSHISSTRRDADMSMLPRWYLSRLIQKPLNRRYIFGSSSNDFNANEMLSDGSDIKSQEYLGSNEIIEDQNPDVADILENDGQHRMLEKRALGHH